MFDLLSGRCPKPIFDLFWGYPTSSGDFGGLGGHLNLNVKFPGPFLAGNCAEKPTLGADMKGGH